MRINFGPTRAASPLATLAFMVCAALALGGCSFDDSSTASNTTAETATSVDKGRRGNVAVAPINHAPTISGTPPSTATSGQAYSFTPAAGDRDNQALTFTIANKPGWLVFNASIGALSGTPANSDAKVWANITISVSDGSKSASLAPFSITVTATTQPPAASTGSATLSWVPPSTNTDNSSLTDLAGFRVYYGKAANALDQIIRITNPTVTQQVVDNLTSGTWYFAVSAVSSTGSESSLSAVASKTFP